jgi:hypothetical protein
VHKVAETGPLKVSSTLKLLSNSLDMDKPDFNFIDRNLKRVIAEHPNLDTKRNRQLYQILYTLKVLHDKDSHPEIR